MTFGEIEILDFFTMNNGEIELMKTAEHEVICLKSNVKKFKRGEYKNLTLKTKVDEKTH